VRGGLDPGRARAGQIRHKDAVTGAGKAGGGCRPGRVIPGEAMKQKHHGAVGGAKGGKGHPALR